LPREKALASCEVALPRVPHGHRARATGRDRQLHSVSRARQELSIAFGDDPRSATIDRLARFALAAFDGAFVAARTDSGSTLGGVLEPLPAALVAARRRP
jgi:hypothetical protein